MFYFGTPENAARTVFDQVVGSVGRDFEDKHYSEMGLEELKDCLVYLRLAYYTALEEGLSDEAVEVVVGWYDEVFLELVEVLDGFRGAVCSRIHRPIVNQNKYWKLCGCGSAN